MDGKNNIYNLQLIFDVQAELQVSSSPDQPQNTYMGKQSASSTHNHQIGVQVLNLLH